MMNNCSVINLFIDLVQNLKGTELSIKASTEKAEKIFLQGVYRGDYSFHIVLCQLNFCPYWL